jgi:hypothetical protein
MLTMAMTREGNRSGEWREGRKHLTLRGKGARGGQGGEMTQTMYAQVNKWTKKN